MAAGTANIEHCARSGAVGTLEPLEQDVIQPSDLRGSRAALGRPRAAHVTRDLSDTWVVQVTPDHDARVSPGIRQNRLQLVAPRPGAGIDRAYLRGDRARVGDQGVRGPRGRGIGRRSGREELNYIQFLEDTFGTSGTLGRPHLDPEPSMARPR